MRTTPVRLLAPIAVLLALSVAGCAAAAPGAAPQPAAAPVLPVVAPFLGDPTPEQFCAAMSAASRAAQQQLAPTGEGMLRDAADRWAGLVSITPAEIKPDVQVMSDYVRRLADGIPIDQAMAEKWGMSVKRFAKYSVDHCGLALKPATPRPGG